MTARIPFLLASLALALGLVAAATLLPRSVVGPLRSEVFSVVDALGSTADWGDLEEVANAVLFAPVGAVLALVGGRRWWWAAIPGATALSFAVEWAQRSTPGRVSDLADVGWNSLGAAVAALAVGTAFAIGRAAGRLRRRAASRSPAVRPPAAR